MLYEPTDPLSSVQYIVYNAPYGCLKKMVDDLYAVHEFDKHSPQVQEAIKKHQQHNYEIYKLDDQKIIASETNYAGDASEIQSKYFDHITGKLYTVDNLSGQIVGAEAKSEFESDEVIKVLGPAIATYTTEFFGDNSHYIALKKDNEYEIIFTCKTHNPTSFYNGSWSSHYKISNGKISGTVVINAHNFENGNVHFKDIKNAEKSIDSSASDANAFVAEIVSQIMDIERKLVKRLQKHFEEDAEALFKTIRVALPYTMERIDWDVNIQKVVQTLRENEGND